MSPLAWGDDVDDEVVASLVDGKAGTSLLKLKLLLLIDGFVDTFVTEVKNEKPSPNDRFWLLLEIAEDDGGETLLGSLNWNPTGFLSLWFHKLLWVRNVSNLSAELLEGSFACWAFWILLGMMYDAGLLHLAATEGTGLASQLNFQKGTVVIFEVPLDKVMGSSESTLLGRDFVSSILIVWVS